MAARKREASDLLSPLAAPPPSSTKRKKRATINCGRRQDECVYKETRVTTRDERCSSPGLWLYCSVVVVAAFIIGIEWFNMRHDTHRGCASICVLSRPTACALAVFVRSFEVFRYPLPKTQLVTSPYNGIGNYILYKLIKLATDKLYLIGF